MAVHLPAFCANCGHVFPATGLAFEGDVSGVVVKGNRQSCPLCGELADIADTTVNIVDGVFQGFSTEEWTRERLLRVQEILRAARAGAVSDEDAVQAIRDEDPRLASVLARGRSQMGTALIALLLIVVAQALAELRDDSATKQDVQDAVNQAVAYCQRYPQPPPVPPEAKPWP